MRDMISLINACICLALTTPLYGDSPPAGMEPRQQQSSARGTTSHQLRSGSRGSLSAADLAARILADFPDQVGEIEAAIAREKSHSRADLLAMYGRSSAASGQLDDAAAAFAMFLREFGIAHDYTPSIVMRLADCLAPLDENNTEIAHTDGGPAFSTMWRFDYQPTPERLHHAVDTYEVAAQLTVDKIYVGRALLKMGWVHRALQDWESSTGAWQCCADSASGTQMGADGLWLAAENLRLMNNPAAAAQLLLRMVSNYPQDARTEAATERAEVLVVEATREARRLDDPVALLQEEIESYSDARSADQVYRSVTGWLRRKGRDQELIAVSRWACDQTDWDDATQIRACYDLVDTLTRPTVRTGDTRAEAAEVLERIMSLTGEGDWLIPAAIRRSRLLSELARFPEADAVLHEIEPIVGNSQRWEPQLLVEMIRSKLDRGDPRGAKAHYETLSRSYPEDAESIQFDGLFGRAPREDKP